MTDIAAPHAEEQAPLEGVIKVGNPHLRSRLQPGEVVLDLGSGAGLDSIIAAWQVGPTGRVIGVDLNPTMCRKAEANAIVRCPRPPWAGAAAGPSRRFLDSPARDAGDRRSVLRDV